MVTEGKTTFTLRIPPFGTAAAYNWSNTRFTSAVPYYVNYTPDTDFGACSGPSWSRIRLVKDYSKGYGGRRPRLQFRDHDRRIYTGSFGYTVLGGVLPSGYPNMVLGFYEGLNYDIEDVEAGLVPYSNFYYYQEDLYSCPAP